MRTTLPRLLLVIAFVVVIFVELRTVLAFVGIDVTPSTVAILGGVTILAIVIWATVPLPGERGSP